MATTSQTIPADLTTFPLFPKLPEDLRFKIWASSANQPRILEVCQLQTPSNITTIKEIDEDGDTIVSHHNSSPFYTPVPIPALLSTSVESRSVALRFFKLSFPNGEKEKRGRIWFNSVADTLYFPSWCWSRIYDWEDAVGEGDRKMVRSIALDCTMWFSPDQWGEGELNDTVHVGKFEGLEEFIWVKREGDKCGCCTEWEKPEKGVVSLEVMSEEERKKFFSGKAERVTEQRLREIGEMKRGRGERWSVPELRFVNLLRNGVPK